MDEKNKQNGEIKYSNSDEEIRAEISAILNTPEEDDDCITSAYKSFVKLHGMDDLIAVFRKSPRTRMPCPDKGVTIETLQWCFERDKEQRELAIEQ